MAKSRTYYQLPKLMPFNDDTASNRLFTREIVVFGNELTIRFPTVVLKIAARKSNLSIVKKITRHRGHSG